MAYRRKSARRTTKRASAARRAPARSYSARRPRSAGRVRRVSSKPRQQVVRLEIVQAPQPVSPNPIADALANQQKETPPPKKARF